VSKPLELTVYPLREKVGRMAERGYIVNRRAVPLWTVDYMDKRLTDAELAAEMFSAVFHESECEVRARQLGEGHPVFNYWLKANHEYARQAEIVERFAMLPHYDEAAS
jgi:hypothetical protein